MPNFSYFYVRDYWLWKKPRKTLSFAFVAVLEECTQFCSIASVPCKAGDQRSWSSPPAITRSFCGSEGMTARETWGMPQSHRSSFNGQRSPEWDSCDSSFVMILSDKKAWSGHARRAARQPFESQSLNTVDRVANRCALIKESKIWSNQSIKKPHKRSVESLALYAYAVTKINK